MNLILKIFAAFTAVVAIAVAAGLLGWRTVTEINGTLNRIIDYELVAEKNITSLGVNLETTTVAQRTLLNNSLPSDVRADQKNRLSLRRCYNCESFEPAGVAEADIHIITDDNGVDWMLYHAYIDNGSSQRNLMLDRVKWDDAGWPIIGNGTPSYSMNIVPVFK